MDEQEVRAKADDVLSKIEAWVPIGNHRWWVAVGVAFVLGCIVQSCHG